MKLTIGNVKLVCVVVILRNLNQSKQYQEEKMVMILFLNFRTLLFILFITRFENPG